MSVTISTLYAAILGLLFIPFTLSVALYRIKHKISLQDGGDQTLVRRMRAQGNFVETVPIALILLVLMELNGASAAWLHALGIVLVAARVTHFLTIATNPTNVPPRMLSMVATFSVYLCASAWLLVRVI